jgi:hypothetical protein
MPFYFRLRYKFPDVVKNKGEAQIIVDTARLNHKLPEFYDGQTIELLDEPTSFVGKAVKQLFG